jgi:hypothetical protein
MFCFHYFLAFHLSVARIICGLYYKCFTIIIYDRNDSGQYYKTMIVVKAILSYP